MKCNTTYVCLYNQKQLKIRKNAKKFVNYTKLNKILIKSIRAVLKKIIKIAYRNEMKKIIISDKSIQ